MRGRSQIEAKIEERVADIRRFQEEIDKRGIRVNAHMADEIARTTKSGQMTVGEAIDKVMADPEKYRYMAPVSSTAELERDTFASYRQYHSDIRALVQKLRPEIAISFSADKKALLLEQWAAVLTAIRPYLEALAVQQSAEKSDGERSTEPLIEG